MPHDLTLPLWRGDDEVPVRVLYWPATRDQRTDWGCIQGDAAHIEILDGPANLSPVEYARLLDEAAEEWGDRQAGQAEDDYERRREAERSD